jgi:hypothetical protein
MERNGISFQPQRDNMSTSLDNLHHGLLWSISRTQGTRISSRNSKKKAVSHYHIHNNVKYSPAGSIGREKKKTCPPYFVRTGELAKITKLHFV